MLFDFGNGPVEAHKHPNGGGMVAETATVDDSAFVASCAQVYDTAQIRAGVRVYDCAKVYGNAHLYDDSSAYLSAKVSGNTKLYDRAAIGSSAKVWGNVKISDIGSIVGFSRVHGDISIAGNTTIVRNCTETPRTIYNLYWGVVAYNEWLHIGCQLHTFAEWRKFTGNELWKMAKGAVAFWKENRELLLSLDRS